MAAAANKLFVVKDFFVAVVRLGLFRAPDRSKVVVLRGPWRSD